MKLAAIAGKEMRDILRERTILVALVVQLFVAGFSTFLTVGLTGLYDPGSITQFPPARIAYVGPDGPVLDDLRAEGNLRVEHLGLDAAREAYANGRYAAVLAVTEGDTRNVTVLLRDQGIQTTLLMTQLKAVLVGEELEMRMQRQDGLATPVLAVESPERGEAVPFAFAYATLLPLLVLTPIFLAGATAGDAFVQEVHTRTLLLLRASPASLATVLGGKILVPVLLAPAQVALWCGLLWLNGLPVHGMPLILATTAMLATLVAAVGIAVSAQVRRNGQAQAGYALVGLAMGVASLFLPRNPMNTIALIATGSLDGPGWATLGILAALTLGVTWACLAFTARRVRQDRV